MEKQNKQRTSRVQSRSGAKPVISVLEASGRSETSDAVLAWAKRVTRRVRNRLGRQVPPPLLTGYRHEGTEFISLEIVGLEGGLYPLTFEIGTGYELNDHDLLVPDSAEALHLCALITSRLDTTVMLI